MIVKCTRCHHEFEYLGEEPARCDWCEGEAYKIGTSWMDKDEDDPVTVRMRNILDDKP